MTTRLLVFVLLVILAGCGSDDSDESEPEAGGTQIALKDFLLQPPNAEVDAGTATFTVINDGDTAHALEIEGNGIEEATDTLQPGDSAELIVELEEGEYEMYCPVGNHREQGMAGTLVVGSGTAGSGSGDGGDEDEGDSGYYP